MFQNVTTKNILLKSITAKKKTSVYFASYSKLTKKVMGKKKGPPGTNNITITDRVSQNYPWNTTDNTMGALVIIISVLKKLALTCTKYTGSFLALHILSTVMP